MYYVLEVPHAGEPVVWFAFDGEDLLRKTAESDDLESWEIFDVSSPLELLEMVGHDEPTPAVREAFPGICRLGDEYGWMTTLCRADYLLGRGAYEPKVVTTEAACEAALMARVGEAAAGSKLKALRIYWSDPQAVLATEGQESLFEQPGGWRALLALREQLLALDVVAES